jgi:hypothetical protein
MALSNIGGTAGISITSFCMSLLYFYSNIRKLPHFCNTKIPIMQPLRLDRSIESCYVLDVYCFITINLPFPAG